MVDVESLLHLDSEVFSSHSADIDNTVSQETHITCQETLVRFEDNGNIERLHKRLIIRRLTKRVAKMCTIQWSQLNFLLYFSRSLGL